MKKVLLLNATYEPLDVVDIERAMILYLSNKVDLLHDSDYKKIHTISMDFPYPEVIRLKKYAHIKRRKVVPTKRNILLRDEYTCQYCGSKKNLTIDHVTPISRGGGNTFENMITCCHKCNNKKGDKTPEEAGMELNKIPTHPSFFNQFKIYSSHNEMNSWNNYIFIN